MSSYGTSSPVPASTRFCWMRWPVFALSWWKRTVLRETAVKSFTGTLTSPNEIAPLQMDRAMTSHCATSRASAATVAPRLAPRSELEAPGLRRQAGAEALRRGLDPDALEAGALVDPP